MLPTFAGVAVHDGLASYRRYDMDHALCAAHHLRELAGIAEATGQDWPTALADLPVAMHVAVQDAKADGKTALARRRRRAYRTRYDALGHRRATIQPATPTHRQSRPAQTRPGWRSQTGAKSFLAVRSYLSTARKQNQDALQVLRVLFTGDAWVPAGPG